MVFNNLLRSTLKTELGSYTKHVSATASGCSQKCLFHAPIPARLFSTSGSLQKEYSNTVSRDNGGHKEHDMLASFTAGWQSTDLHPLVIEKSVGSYVYDINGKKYLDTLAGLWCTALGIPIPMWLVFPVENEVGFSKLEMEMVISTTNLTHCHSDLTPLD